MISIPLALATFVIEAVVLIGAAAVFVYFREKTWNDFWNAARETHREQLTVSREMLEDERHAHQDTTDRLHATRNLPPGGVDLKARYEEIQAQRKEAEAIERVNGGPVRGPRRIGTVEKVTAQMADDVRQQQTQALKDAAEAKRKEQAS